MSTPLPFPGALKRGDISTKVSVLQSLLQSQGHYTSTVDGQFGRNTEAGLKGFQNTHVGPDREFLKVTGVLDKPTWWALQNPSGALQRNNLGPRIPEGVTGQRRKLLEICLQEHTAGVKEDPDGSNYGDGVTKYLQGVGPAFWCAYCVSWIIKQATGKFFCGERIGLVSRFWELAEQNKLLILPDAKGVFTTLPQPGDLGVYRYKNSSGRLTGLGHIFIVASVSPDGSRMNTFGGNEGNRFKFGTRPIKAVSDFAGFISFLPKDENPERLLITADGVQSGTAATR